MAILLRNDLPFIEALLAANFAGAYAVPINWHYKAEEVNDILVDAGARYLVVHADLLRPIRESLPGCVFPVCVPTPPEICEAYSVGTDQAAVPPGCVSWEEWLLPQLPQHERPTPAGGTMFYTSGTTGRPKGVKRERAAGSGGLFARLAQEWFGFRPGMRTAMIGPLYHSVQTSYVLAALRGSGDIFLPPRFDAEGLLSLIDEKRLTHLHLVPIMMKRLLQLPSEVRRKYDISSLEFVVHGAAPCPGEVKRQMIDWWGPIIHEYYGTTEAGMISRANSKEWLRREGTVGRAWPGRTVRIYGEDGTVLPSYAEGEVYMSLGLVPDFTYQNADDERAAIERDGLVTSGDIGYLDDDGYLFLCDRKRDVVISGGVNIYTAEVEAVLDRHPAVLDSAAFGIPDEAFGEALMAVVELLPGTATEPEELREFARARLTSFKVPRIIEVRSSVPRDDSGKMFKRALRDPYWAAAGRRI